MAMNERHLDTRKIGFIAPVGGAIEGKPYLINGVFGIAFSSVAAGERCTLQREGGFMLEVDAVGDDVVPGTKVYFNAGRVADEVHNDSTVADALYIGFVALDTETDIVAGDTGEVEVFIDRLPAQGVE